MTPDVLLALVKTIELKDGATAAHSWRVVLYARALAERLGVDRDVIGRLTTAAALHDLGKIDVPDDVLRKPGPLTEEEFALVRTHPVTGHDRLVGMGEKDPIVLGLVRHHHERIDGRGYPDGLAGADIPLAARMFSVIDSFDALTSHRPYRHDVGEHAGRRAVVELQAGIDTRYCAEAVEAFADLFHTGELDWILHHFNDADAPEFTFERDRLEHAARRDTSPDKPATNENTPA